MTVTPMMAQYLEIKSGHPDALLFYRMGDFYEMFFDDAVAAAEALDIALTKRGKHDGGDIPMCGVPAHSSEGYLLTLIRKGFRVAVCEQMESPAEAKKRGSKSVVRRDVVRLVTPGTLTEDSLLEARRHNYLAAFAEVRGAGGLAWVDISTGAFHVMALPRARLGPELARLAPSELLVPEPLEPELRPVAEDFALPLTPIARSAFDSASGDRQLRAQFNVGTLEGFGQFSRAETSAMGAVLHYLEITQRGKLPLLKPPRQESEDRSVRIDAATRRNLELTHSLAGGRSGSLLSVIDHTVTSGGARLLERRLSSPTRRLDVIEGRLDAVRFLVDETALRDDLRGLLRAVPDLDRALSRLSLDRGGPRDLAVLRTALSQSADIVARMPDDGTSERLNAARHDLLGHDALCDLLDAALVAEPPLLARDGGFIAAGYHPELDEARALRDEGRGIIARMQQDFVSRTGISSLKIKHNNVLGYFVETTATHAEKMRTPPLSETFIHRQTTANQVRFTTVELSDLETRILTAGSRALEIEKQIFEELRVRITDAADRIFQTSSALAELDLAAALAELAARENWCRPTVDDSMSFNIISGRHPVVEHVLKTEGGATFIANDCALGGTSDPERLWLVTGPNMAGKSTFLRQNAIIAILAQMGSFVPADRAHIGLVSQVFSRVGAADDLARGRSTFMVEMVETATILNQADDRALVILDEIGRGTATYDGLSIAWATLEHLHDVNRSRALFATHYHELTALASDLSHAANATVAVREWEGDVIFLHEVIKGAADRSYGVQVAKLAGLPDPVISRAKAVLEKLESNERDSGGTRKGLVDDLPLFSAAPSKPAPKEPSAVEARLENIEPDDLSPRQALELVYQLKAAAKS